MFREISKLVIYRNLEEDSILFKFADICEKFMEGGYQEESLINEIYQQIHRLLDISTQYGFDHNLWHCYLAYILATNENPFSITMEKVGAVEGSVNKFAIGDFSIFKRLFDYDFSEMEKELNINCFSTILDYHAIEKKEQRYHKSVSDKVKVLAKEIEKAFDGEIGRASCRERV